MFRDSEFATEMYTAQTKQQANLLIEQHHTLVKRIACHLMARLPPDIAMDDLIQAGLIGLLDAGKQYDPSQGAKFETYATIRIRGAMLDEVRRQDWAPKSVHKKARDLSAAIHLIETREGRDARDVEVAAEMGITLDEYYQILMDNSSSRMLSFDDLETDETHSLGIFEDRHENVLKRILDDEFQERLAEAIAGLPEREKLVMSLYYDAEMNLKEVGQIVGVSESRVSQLLTQAQLRLQARLKD